MNPRRNDFAKDESPTWENFGLQVGKRYEGFWEFHSKNMRDIPLAWYLKNAVNASYTADNLSTAYLHNKLKFNDAISIPKLFNPFLHISNLIAIAQFGIAKGIDGLFRSQGINSSVTATRMKRIINFPLILLSAAITPLSHINKMPFLNRFFIKENIKKQENPVLINPPITPDENSTSTVNTRMKDTLQASNNNAQFSNLNNDLDMRIDEIINSLPKITKAADFIRLYQAYQVAQEHWQVHLSSKSPSAESEEATREFLSKSQALKQYIHERNPELFHGLPSLTQKIISDYITQNDIQIPAELSNPPPLHPHETVLDLPLKTNKDKVIDKIRCIIYITHESAKNITSPNVRAYGKRIIGIIVPNKTSLINIAKNINEDGYTVLKSTSKTLAIAITEKGKKLKPFISKHVNVPFRVATHKVSHAVNQLPAFRNRKP